MNEKKREQENVLRLVKKSRKGILRVVFSRFGLMALLLVLELVLLWMMWRWFNNDFEWFAAVQGVFTVLMFFHLFNSDMDATGKLTWMFLLAVIPIPASIFLWFTEKDVGPNCIGLTKMLTTTLSFSPAASIRLICPSCR